MTENTQDSTWRVVPADDRIPETFTLGAPGSCPWAEVTIGDHLTAVLVFGATQEEADARAAAIVAFQSVTTSNGEVFTTRVHKALPTHSTDRVPDLIISATEAIPEIRGAAWVQEAQDLHQREGRAVAEALWQHLPGGTTDQILRALLEHRASLLSVRF